MEPLYGRFKCHPREGACEENTNARSFALAPAFVGTVFHSLAPKGRGWGEGVTIFPYRTAGAPSSHLLPAGEKE